MNEETKENEEITPEEIRYLKEVLGSELTDTGYPEPPSKDGLVKFFRDVLNLKKEENEQISRTGNLKEEEIGMLPLTARTYNNIATYAEQEGMEEVAQYLQSKSQITINTSLSRKAKFLELFVTQKKISRSMGAPKREIKKGMFGETVTEEGVDET